MTRSDGLTLADEWFADFIAGLERSTNRRRRLWRERVVLPVADQLAIAAQDKTEHLRRQIAVERERWLAEQTELPLRAA